MTFEEAIFVRTGYSIEEWREMCPGAKTNEELDYEVDSIINGPVVEEEEMCFMKNKLALFNKR